ncbi:HDOD domain protein [Vibrio aerogenes CECT 7868]|uniref:HDOD domain protein n=1 Tax=Vibrio aerogenes CECT 7868 TaxID=1216006 RepID=A0A1M6CBM4_9VIBR|nr:HDOD domain-containing protein [Vibrio aerogenes]SHI58283.1 HDOD domain protein [Vibrio aerogenes CECT 7868]
MKLEVICVDDDEFMLKAIGRVFRCLRPEWQVLLIPEPLQWKTQWKSSGFGEPAIFISDLLMPKKKGDELLGEVKKYFPEAVRVLLTGDTSADIPKRAHDFAHFVLPKPFTQYDFERLFVSAERLHKMPFNGACRKKLGLLAGLPILPNAVRELQQVIASPDCDVRLMAEVISHEPALTARVFQIANSSYFGFRRVTDSLPEAIGRLGATLLETIALSLLAHIPYKRVSPSQQKRISEKALKTASVARMFAKNLQFSRRDQDKVFIATILTAIGRLLVIEEGAAEDQVRDFLGLQETFEDHHVVAAYLLILWGYEIETGELILNQNKVHFSSENEAERLGSTIALATLTEPLETEEQFEQLALQLPEQISAMLMDLMPQLLEAGPNFFE